MALRWSVDVKAGETLSSRCVLNGRRGVVTHVSLVDPPPSALGGRSVVEAYVKTVDRNLALASLSSERPRAELPRPVLVMGNDSFCSSVRRHGGDAAGDGAAVVVRFEGRFNNSVLPPPPLEDEEDHPLSSEEDEDDDESMGSDSGDDDDGSMGSDSQDDDDSSSEEDESDGEVDGQEAMTSSDDDDVLVQW